MTCLLHQIASKNASYRKRAPMVECLFHKLSFFPSFVHSPRGAANNVLDFDIGVNLVRTPVML